MRHLNSNLVMNFISEQVYDPIEKTYVAYTPLEDYMCMVVAESYDNELELNSAQLAVEAVLTAFEKKPSIKRIPEYIRYANEQILLHSTKSQLMVSLTVLVSDYTRMRYGTIGNTRLYVMYENLFTHISKTQTAYSHIIEKEEGGAPDYSQIHNLTEYLGKGKHVKPFISKITELTEGSTILFATSNLWGRLSEIEILDAYEYTKTGREFLDILQELLLSIQDDDEQKLGSFTAAILYIEKKFQEDAEKPKKRKRLIFAAILSVCIILLIVLLTLLCIRALDQSKMKEIERYGERGMKYIGYGNYGKALEEYEHALELTDGLNMGNRQYIDEKREISQTVADRQAVLTLVQEAEASLLEKNYGTAQKLYEQIQKEAKYQDLAELSEDSEKKLEEIRAHMQIAQLISLGDMYDSTQDYEEALQKYEQALKELADSPDLEEQGEVQSKIYGIRQKQKEARETKKEAKQEAKEKEKAEKEAEEKAAADKAAIKINTLIIYAANALDEGRISRARELYQQALSRYNKFSGSSEDADKLYKDIIALGQSITEAEAKAVETEREEKAAQAAKYAIQAKEAARDGDIDAAKKLYNSALDIYIELNIWDERTEAIYDAIDGLEQEGRTEAQKTEQENEGKTNKLESIDSFGGPK